MKKAAAIIVVLFLAVAGILLATAPEPTKEVRLLSLPQDYSRVIASPGETLGIVILADSEDSFITEASQIRSARIMDEEGEMAVSMASVEFAGEPVSYEGKSYFPFRFNLGFTEVFSTDLSVGFVDADLEIAYENETVLNFPIGNVHLRFDDLTEVSHFELMRLFGTIGAEAGESILTGFVLELAPNVTSDIVILGVSALMQSVKVDFSGIIPLDEVPNRETPVEQLLGTPAYASVRENLPVETGTLSWPDSGRFFVPVVHLGEGRSLSRFPIEIRYSYLGTEYRSLIDDFLFFAPQTLPEVLLDDVRQITYRY